jgi:hypothetical protein
VLALVLVLFWVMGVTLLALVGDLLVGPVLDFRPIVAELLFILVMIELPWQQILALAVLLLALGTLLRFGDLRVPARTALPRALDRALPDRHRAGANAASAVAED